MRILVAVVFAALLLAGCSHPAAPKPLARPPGATALAPIASTNNPQLIVTPDTDLAGKVAMVNQQGRFAVLNFQIGRLPALGAVFNVYHLGLKIGEITITGPQQDENIIGNITAGDAATGDVVREQ